MINRNAVFRKTAKGIATIATRKSGMSPKLRSALIMVDGKRSFDDLAQVVSVLGNPEELLTELAVSELIEQVLDAGAIAGGQLTSHPTTAVMSPPTVAANTGTLAESQRFTSRLLMELLGPTSEGLCLKIEAARDLGAFVEAVKRARDVLREVKGQAVAARFIEQIETRMPAPVPDNREPRE